MKVNTLVIFAAGIVFGLGGFYAWQMVANHTETAEEHTPSTATAPTPAQDEPAVTLDEKAIKMGGITTSPLQPISHRQQINGMATVLSVVDLNNFNSEYVSGKARLEAALAALNASRKEYDRLQSLHDNRNVSDKELQAAESAMASDESHVLALQESLHTIELNGRQNWGDILAGSVIGGHPLFKRLSSQQDLLVQVAIPSTLQLRSLPQDIRLKLPDARFVEAKTISLSPRTDPKFQGATLFCSVPSKNSALSSGMSIQAYIPTGAMQQGFFIPNRAVVWLQGKAWIYTQEGTGHYVREELSTASPMDDGWFVGKDDISGKPIVVTGAQLLLSQELRPQTSNAGVGDDDDD